MPIPEKGMKVGDLKAFFIVRNQKKREHKETPFHDNGHSFNHIEYIYDNRVVRTSTI